MKARPLATALSFAVTLSSGVFPGFAAEPEVLSRGPHETVMKSENRKWVTLATGLNRVLADGQTYVECRSIIEDFQNGSLARETQHQLITARDAADENGTVDILWPNGQRCRTRTTALAYSSRKTGQSTIFAEVKAVQSQVAGAQTLWADCFEGASCDLLVRNGLAGTECDVVARAQFVDPLSLGFGANDDTIMLQVWHQLLDGAPPRVVRHTRVVDPEGANYVKPHISDEHLDWGSFFIGQGRCFAIGNQNDPQAGTIPVYKTTGQTPDGKWWLIEECRYADIAPLLATLPVADAGRKAEQMRYLAGKRAQQKEGFYRQIAALGKTEGKKGSEGKKRADAGESDIRRASRGETQAEGFAARVGRLGKKKETVTASLDWDRKPGVVLDYLALSAGTTNGYVWAGSVTYYISGTYNVGGVSYMEPGVCIKMSKTNSAQICITGSGATLTTLGTHWNPIIITSVDDNSIGETLPGSDGSPGQFDYERGLNFDYLSSGVLANINNLRISYAFYGIRLYYGTNHVISHTQLIGGYCGVYADHADFKLRNVLMYDLGMAVYGDSSSAVHGEHVTLHKITGNVNYMGYPSGLYFTNSLIMGVTNNYGSTYSGASNSVSLTVGDTFEPQVGAGRNYLNTWGPNPERNSGTTNIDADLLKEIRKLTTYPPVVLTNYVLMDTVLWPRAQRDVDLPDRGAHFAPIDYLVCYLTVTNATLILTQGVVLGTFGTSGIWLQDNATLISHGSVLRHNHIVRYNNIQEIATNLMNGSLNANVAVNPFNYSNGPVTARFRFTDFDKTANSGYHLYSMDFDWIFSSLSIRDCEFNSAEVRLGGTTNTVMALTNNLFNRTWCTFDGFPAFYAYNNLFRGLYASFEKWDPNITWIVRDNAFDESTVGDYGYAISNSHNAYIRSLGTLGASGGNDITLANFAYETGPLSRWYQTTNSTLWNAGSLTNAGLIGMYHYATRTNITMLETNSTLDIGWHPIGSTLAGIPVLQDADGDGRWDALEDINGNATYDAGAGETDWLNYDSLLGIGPGPGLVVFTPLK